MKLLNVDLVRSDYGDAVYVLGKLWAEGEVGIDWIPILKNNVVHISSVKYADGDWAEVCLVNGFPRNYSEIQFSEV